MEVYLDANFAGKYDYQDTKSKDTARSRHGCIVIYNGYPVSWTSQLKTEICLSSTESEYTGLLHSLREIITLKKLLQEIKQHSFPRNETAPKIRYRVVQDNSGAL